MSTKFSFRLVFPDGNGNLRLFLKTSELLNNFKKILNTLWNVFVDASQPIGNMIVHPSRSPELDKGRNSKTGLCSPESHSTKSLL